MARPIDPKARTYRYFVELIASLGRLATSMEIDDCGDSRLAKATIAGCKVLSALAVKHLERLRKSDPSLGEKLKVFYTDRPKAKR